MKLIDCFMYFDEDLVLDIRLNTLCEIVDKFVIVEATTDHAGNQKKLNFNKKNFKKFENKIHYIVDQDLPKQVSFFKKNWRPEWHRENAQRNKLEVGYADCSDEDLIMISDIDEIPDPEKLKEFKIEKKYACFLQKNFQSKLNLLNVSDGDWAGTRICQKKYLKSPQWLRNFKLKRKSFWNIFGNRMQIINNGGWHFSFLKDPQSIKNKIMSYSHQEYNTDEFTNTDLIKEKISKGKDLFNRDIIYEKISINDNFPKYIINNKEKFKDWIL